MTQIEGKRVLVTGASSGIGAAIARELARAGAVVGICARTTERLAEVLEDCRRLSPGSVAWTVDLADLSGIERFARTVEADLGAVDVLVNNAGLVRTTRLPMNADWELVERLNVVNYLSPVKLTLALLPGMLERGEGSILTVSSLGARLAPPAESAYAASKAALTAFLESAAVDLWHSGVRFHLLFPGLVRVSDEPFDADHGTLHTGMEALSPDEVATAARRQIEQGRLEAYIPEGFKNMAVERAKDLEGMTAATAEWARVQFES